MMCYGLCEYKDMERDVTEYVGQRQKPLLQGAEQSLICVLSHVSIQVILEQL